MKPRCKCVQDLEKQLCEHFEAEKASVVEMNLLNGTTFNNFDLTKVGKKKRLKKVVLHSFCPWCGVRYDGV